ncbi:MAG: hypothetical protein ABSG62_19815 [Terracidiphilus sp.]|jgi:hypothetical protein
MNSYLKSSRRYALPPEIKNFHLDLSIYWKFPSIFRDFAASLNRCLCALNFNPQILAEVVLVSAAGSGRLKPYSPGAKDGTRSAFQGESFEMPDRANDPLLLDC